MVPVQALGCQAPLDPALGTPWELWVAAAHGGGAGGLFLSWMRSPRPRDSALVPKGSALRTGKEAGCLWALEGSGRFVVTRWVLQVGRTPSPCAAGEGPRVRVRSVPGLEPSASWLLPAAATELCSEESGLLAGSRAVCHSVHSFLLSGQPCGLVSVPWLRPLLRVRPRVPRHRHPRSLGFPYPGRVVNPTANTGLFPATAHALLWTPLTSPSRLTGTRPQVLTRGSFSIDF